MTRDGDTLRTTVDLDLKEALTGWSKTVTTIDGKKIRVAGSGPTQPGHEEHYPHLGMPNPKKNGERGDLVVVCKVKFPSSLTPETKARLKEIL